MIEIPKGSHSKHGYSFISCKVRYDRMIFSSMIYPTDYGFVSELLALDSDPLNVLVLATEPTFPGCVAKVKLIGVLHMVGEKGSDEKMVCVPVSDPVWNKINDLSDLNSHFIKEAEHFLSVYKGLEKKEVATNDWDSIEETVGIYHECKERYIDSRKSFSIN